MALVLLVWIVVRKGALEGKLASRHVQIEAASKRHNSVLFDDGAPTGTRRLVICIWRLQQGVGQECRVGRKCVFCVAFWWCLWCW